MRLQLSLAFVASAFATLAHGALWSQCGGTGFTGSTACTEGACTVANADYSFCAPPGPPKLPPKPKPTPGPKPEKPIRLPNKFEWVSTGPLMSPKNDSRQLAGIKDPSIVFHDGVWHVFATTAKSGSWHMFYTNFTDWNKAELSEFYYLDQSPIGPGYRAAPQIFYFAPQKLWYLVYQDNNAAYSTNPDISNPAGWTAPLHFYDKRPKIVDDHIGEGYWLDFWVICDKVNCHLFSSDDNGQLYRSQTPVKDFPHGMNEPVIAMQDSNRFRLFEAANVYAFDKSYLLIVEAIGEDSRRWFRSWTSDKIEGPWKALAAEEDNSFARSNNVKFEGAVWTKDISHGELIRSGIDQRLRIDPCNLVYFYQGQAPEANDSGIPYGDLPWRLALIKQTNSLC